MIDGGVRSGIECRRPVARVTQDIRLRPRRCVRRWARRRPIRACVMRSASQQREEIKTLKSEVAELRQANETCVHRRRFCDGARRRPAK